MRRNLRTCPDKSSQYVARHSRRSRSLKNGGTGSPTTEVRKGYQKVESCRSISLLSSVAKTLESQKMLSSCQKSKRIPSIVTNAHDYTAVASYQAGLNDIHTESVTDTINNYSMNAVLGVHQLKKVHCLEF